MAKRRMILSGLLKSSVAAYFSAIEIHNKPNFEYRYEITTILMINAWELLLKAYVRKCTKQSIFIRGNSGKTIAFKTALDKTYENLSGSQRQQFKPIKGNLILLLEYRDTYSHYFDKDLDPIIFALLAKAAENYVDFYKTYFGKNPLEGKNLYLLPLGFSLPFEPAKFLIQEPENNQSSKETTEFIKSITRVITDLDNEGIDDSVILSFDIHFYSSKNETNTDILAKLDPQGTPISQQKTYRITTDKSATPIQISDEDFYKLYPLTYDDLTAECRKIIPEFKQGKKYNAIVQANIKENPDYSNTRSLKPNDPNPRFYYSYQAVDEIARLWNLQS